MHVYLLSLKEIHKEEEEVGGGGDKGDTNFPFG